jgi:ABC-type antimicrobial peptide transport system permease subunit
MTDVLREPTVGRRFASIVLVSFGGATLLLALLGVYGVFTILVQERTREMGVRRALGAQRATIVRTVLMGVLAVAATGAAVGVLGALWATRLLRSLLYGVAPADPGTLVVVVGGSLLLALAAGLAPAMRASSVDPAISLRSD